MHWRIYEGKKFEKIFWQKYLVNPYKIKLWRVLDHYDQKSMASLNQAMHCDFIGFINQFFVAIELKETANLVYFNSYKINPRQQKFLKEFSDHGGKSIIIIYASKLAKIYIIEYDEIIKKRKSGKIFFESFINCELQNIFDQLKLLVKK